MDSTILAEGLKTLGITPTEIILQSFEIYLNELKKWSKVHNLTAIHDDKGIIERHFLDSLLFLKALPDDVITIADIGSGAGFPGIPLKIVNRNLKIWLIEARQKKTAFLRNIIYKLNLNDVKVIEKRVEDIIDGEIDIEIDVGVVRALFKADDFVKMVSPIIKKDGIMILSKGHDYKKELDGFIGSYNIMSLQIPNTEIKRNIISIVNVS
ncbi:MAG: 16S rRNA (guanine(527)-N(7))-methyltransferase RsmG [Nitrospirae bacterium]|nr:16S rRNA (guanine(527)-N(7))-methyltransferase RsmG [Nitrospirota bacterium]MBF0540854.1 16S rRNA (guanine(527)-N(7))-methyltransferase RsmG [Nitrospirota bacterium]